MRIVRTLMVMTSLSAIAAPAAVAASLQSMKPDEITLLQKRLTDAGCYRGPLDGAPTEATAKAIKACPAQDPMLVIESGQHSAVVRYISGDAECKVVATGSDDKSVRLWSTADGRLLKTFRMPLGSGSGGKVNAVAMSKDGSLVAAGGWDAFYESGGTNYVYLYDVATGNVRLLGPYGSTIKAMEIAPNGRDLAVVLGGSAGLQITDMTSGRTVAADKDYNGDAYGVTFASDGTLFTTGLDGYVRRYASGTYKRLAKAKTPSPQPFGISADPVTSRLAVGYLQNAPVNLLDPVSLASIATIDNKSQNGNFFANAWRPDGGQLLLAGNVTMEVNGGFRDVLRPFSPVGQKAGADIPVTLDALMKIAGCGTGYAYAAADPAFGVVTGGKAKAIGTKVTADMRGKTGDAFLTSSDGKLVRFGLSNGGKDPVLFDLASATLDVGKETLGLIKPNPTALNLTDWLDNYMPKLNGKVIPLDNTETSRAVAVRPDRAGFVMGAEFGLRSFDAQGKLRWRVEMPGVTWGVNLAQNGQVVQAAIGDGTIRWYRWSDGAALLSLFIDAPTKRWVAWTPSGYYMASPGGEDLIGWHVNRGWNQTPDFFSASRFRDKFSRPDVVQRVLDVLDEAKAVDAANAASRVKPEQVQPILTQLPPVVTIANMKDGESFNGTQVTLEYAVRSPSGLPVDKIDVLIDGRPASENRGLGRLDGAKPQEGTAQITVQVPQKDVEVALIARAGALTSEAATVRLTYAGKVAIPATGAGADLLKPKLYALVIGVADYVDPDLKLGLSSKDARDFATAIKAQSGQLYGTVEVKLLVDREATRDSILDGLEWLEKQVTSRDVGMVFLAGHGVNDDKQTFWFLPSDANPQKLRSKAVSHDDIRRTLQALPGKSVLFLDACHAGRAATAMVATRGATDINQVVNEFSSAENGVVTFASSTGRELSQENPEWGNGAFTKALIEGIGQGKADLLGKGTITLSQLDAFVVNRVKELTNGTQHAVMTRPPTIGDFPIAVKK